MGELDPREPAVLGTDVLRHKFSAGLTGTVTVLLQNDSANFTSFEGRQQIQSIVDELSRRKDDLGLDDIRSLVDPLGESATVKQVLTDLPRL